MAAADMREDSAERASHASHDDRPTAFKDDDEGDEDEDDALRETMDITASSHVTAHGPRVSAGVMAGAVASAGEGGARSSLSRLFGVAVRAGQSQSGQSGQSGGGGGGGGDGSGGGEGGGGGGEAYGQFEATIAAVEEEGDDDLYADLQLEVDADVSEAVTEDSLGGLRVIYNGFRDMNDTVATSAYPSRFHGWNSLQITLSSLIFLISCNHQSTSHESRDRALFSALTMS
jgi:hypothetical protein